MEQNNLWPNFLSMSQGWMNCSHNPKKGKLLLLMVQKSGVHQLRLVVYPIIYKVFYNTIPQVGFLAGFLVAISIGDTPIFHFKGYLEGQKIPFHLKGDLVFLLCPHLNRKLVAT